MKLYFRKPITDSDKLKFLEWYMGLNDDTAEYVLSIYNKSIHQGYINLYETGLNEETIEELKALNIWQGKKVIGKFWDYDKNDYMVGIYGGVDEADNGTLWYRQVTSNGKFICCFKNFKQITSLEDLE